MLCLPNRKVRTVAGAPCAFKGLPELPRSRSRYLSFAGTCRDDASDVRRHLRDGWPLEEAREAHLNPKIRANSRQDSCCDERLSAEIEEVISGTDRRNRETFRPDARYRFLNIALWGYERTCITRTTLHPISDGSQHCLNRLQLASNSYQSLGLVSRSPSRFRQHSGRL